MTSQNNNTPKFIVTIQGLSLLWAIAFSTILIYQRGWTGVVDWQLQTVGWSVLSIIQMVVVLLLVKLGKKEHA